MLWVYINNQGVAECKVNVGNRIRQGNGFYVFVVLEGQQNVPQTMVWTLQDIGYLKPGSTEFVYVTPDSDPVETEETFNLYNPSQANSYFVGGTTYKGYKVFIDSQATNFPSNGGHVALSFLMMDANEGGVFADTISVYVEATQGMHPITITADDYATLVSLFRASNVFNIGEKDGIGFLDDYFGAAQAVYFTVDGNPYVALVSFDSQTKETTQTLIFIEDGLLLSRFRKYSYEGDQGSWGEWSDESFLDEITSIERTAGTGEAGTVDTYTIYTKAHSEGITAFQVTNGVAAGFGQPTASAVATTVIPGASAGASVAITVDPDSPNDAKIFDFAFSFDIPKGADAVMTETSGMFGFQIDANGHLIVNYAGSTAPDISVNPSGHLIYTY